MEFIVTHVICHDPPVEVRLGGAHQVRFPSDSEVIYRAIESPPGWK